MSLRQTLIFLILLCGSLPGLARSAEEPLGRVNWESWRTLPVFDEGRIMPLNTFSRILVAQICGTTTPKIVVDHILLLNLESDLRLKYKYEPQLAATEAARIRKRIDELFPRGERTLESYELLYSWLVEPDVWDFLPFLQHEKAVLFRADVLDASRLNQAVREIRYIAPIQLDASKAYNDLLDRVRDRQMQAARVARESGNPDQTSSDPLSEFEKIAVDLHGTLSIYRTLTYQSEPVVQEFSNTFLLAIKKVQEGFSTASQSWTRLTQQGIERELSTANSNPTDLGFSERFKALALLFAQINRQIQTQEEKAVSLARIELQLDAILKLTDGAIEEEGNLYRVLYASKPLNPSRSASDLAALRDDAVTLHASLALVKRAAEAAILSLYQNGRTVRVLPALYDDVLRPDVASSSGFELPDTSPWVSLNLVLRGGSPTIRRFVDRDCPWDIAPETTLELLFETELVASLSEPVKKLLQRPTAFPSDLPEGWLIKEDQEKIDQLIRTKKANGSFALLRTAFQESSDAYTGEEGGNRGEQSRSVRFNSALLRFADALRQTADRMEPIRQELLPVDQRDADILRKTAYPVPGALDVEYLYSRFNPFYWMGIAAGIGLFLLACSVVMELCRRWKEHAPKDKKSPSKKKEKKSGKNRNRSTPVELLSRGREPSLDTIGIPGETTVKTLRSVSERLRLAEEIFLGTGMFAVFVAIAITFVGGALRSYISGWAPVSNMFETIVLMSFIAACLGLWMTLQPLLGPPLAKSWTLTAYPWTIWYRAIFQRNPKPNTLSSPAAELEGIVPQALQDSPNAENHYNSLEAFHRSMIALARSVLIVLTLIVVMFASYHEYSDGQGLFDAVLRSFAMNDPIDWIVVFFSICAVVWFVPRLFLSCILLPVLLVFPSRSKSETTEDIADSLRDGPFRRTANMEAAFQWAQTRDSILHRKTFVLVGALIVCIAAAVTQINPKEFNPNIRPLAAVLRSNFWLAVHVIAIVISYASGLIAWLLALVSLGAYIFGHYRKVEYGKPSLVVLPPHFCDALAPYVRKMLKIAVWMLMIGTILGARWADYSWGRFWSWDVKEVWALITLLTLLFVLHGRKARFYGEFGVAIGAVFGGIAIVMTWYGFNFVFSMGRHSYGHGDSSWATYFLLTFIIVNLLWTMCAVVRYMTEFGERKRP